MCMCHRRKATDILFSHVHYLDISAPDAVKVVTGDFNHCDLKKTPPIMKSMSLVSHAVTVHWTCFIPLCTMRTGPCLCRHLGAPITVYPATCRPLVRRQPPVTKTVGNWSKDSRRLWGDVLIELTGVFLLSVFLTCANWQTLLVTIFLSVKIVSYLGKQWKGSQTVSPG